MYTVQIFCTVPEYVELDGPKLRRLNSKKLVSGGFSVKTFDNLDELFCYIRKFDYFDSRREAVKNHFLDAVMCSEKETRRHMQFFEETGTCRYTLAGSGSAAEAGRYYLGYLTRNEKGKVFDPRNYIEELYKFDFDAYKEMLYKERCRKYDALRREREARWEEHRKLYAIPDYYGYYRKISTMPEKRWSVNVKHFFLNLGRQFFPRLGRDFFPRVGR